MLATYTDYSLRSFNEIPTATIPITAAPPTSKNESLPAVTKVGEKKILKNKV